MVQTSCLLIYFLYNFIYNVDKFLLDMNMCSSMVFYADYMGSLMHLNQFDIFIEQKKTTIAW